MLRNFRLGMAGVFMVLVVLVDFTSRLLSVAADAALASAAIAVILPLLKKK